MQLFVQWAKQSTSIRQRIAILGLGVLIFPLAIPFFLATVPPQIDARLGAGFHFAWPAAVVLGVILLITGGLTAFWTIAAQITLASGTPFPMMPTKRLITTGPFGLCRNPMTLGTILAYLGFSLIVGSVTSILIVALFAGGLLTYLKMIEEKELAVRFGEEYLVYKASTPFILPRLRGRKGNRS
jgi:protein-S-isoprenylcysteine O-methyltransferase Ste14